MTFSDQVNATPATQRQKLLHGISLRLQAVAVLSAGALLCFFWMEYLSRDPAMSRRFLAVAGLGLAFACWAALEAVLFARQVPTHKSGLLVGWSAVAVLLLTFRLSFAFFFPQWQEGGAITIPGHFQPIQPGVVCLLAAFVALCLTFVQITTLYAFIAESVLLVEVQQARLAVRHDMLMDMHDGFGSRLTRMRLMAESGQLDIKDFSGMLGRCMMDLYLIVDRLGNDDGSLVNALVDFHYRIRQGHELGGLEVRMHLPDAQVPALNPKTIVQLLRILDEATNNAMKHAHCQSIDISLAEGVGGRILLTVRDDGTGLAPDAVHGHGLAGIRARAADIGAEVEFRDASPGTEVRVSLPRPGG